MAQAPSLAQIRANTDHFSSCVGVAKKRSHCQEAKRVSSSKTVTPCFCVAFAAVMATALVLVSARALFSQRMMTNVTSLRTESEASKVRMVSPVLPRMLTRVPLRTASVA